MRVPALEVTIISHSPLIHLIFTNKLHLCSHITHHCTILHTLQLFQNSGVLFLWLKTVCKYKHSMLSTISQYFQKPTLEKFLPQPLSDRKHTNEILPCWKRFKTKSTDGEKQNMSANVPGSKGHSLSLANSAGVFPVRTQLELRSIIGILQENQLHF